MKPLWPTMEVTFQQGNNLPSPGWQVRCHLLLMLTLYTPYTTVQVSPEPTVTVTPLFIVMGPAVIAFFPFVIV